MVSVCMLCNTCGKLSLAEKALPAMVLLLKIRKDGKNQRWWWLLCRELRRYRTEQCPECTCACIAGSAFSPHVPGEVCCPYCPWTMMMMMMLVMIATLAWTKTLEIEQ